MLTSEHASEPGYENAFRAMLDMTKLDIRALEAAAERSVMPG
jgi:hypothetical protein